MSPSRPSHPARLIGATLLLLLAGCAVGPNFRRPAPPDVAAFTSPPASATAAVPEVAGGDAQRFTRGADISGEWWTLFHSPALNELIEQSLKNNHDLKAARAALLVTRENVLAQRGVYYPSVAASFAASRQRQSGQIAPTLNSNAFLYNLFTPAGDRLVRSRRFRPESPDRGIVESAGTGGAFSDDRDVHHAHRQRRGHGDSNELAAGAGGGDAASSSTATPRPWKFFKYQFSKGYASRLDMAAQESQLAQVAATLPPLVKQLAQLHDLLAALTGRFPSSGAGGEIRTCRVCNCRANCR